MKYKGFNKRTAPAQYIEDTHKANGRAIENLADKECYNRIKEKAQEYAAFLNTTCQTYRP